MAQIDETGVAVGDIYYRSREWQRGKDVGGILNGTQVDWCNASQHLPRHIRLHWQWNLAQIKVASIRFCIKECQIYAFVAVLKAENERLLTVQWKKAFENE